MKILAIESASITASAAIMQDNVLLAEYTVNVKKTHSQTLLPMISQICDVLGIRPSEFDYVAVSSGPGSYTGLRIGAATAKGIAMGAKPDDDELNGIPLVAVPTLEGLAYNFCGMRDFIICPVMDARRQRVYCGIYEFTDSEKRAYDSEQNDINGEDGSGERLNIISPQEVIECSELIEKLNIIGRPVIFTGDGVDLIRKYAAGIDAGFQIARPHMSTARAGSVAAAAQDMIRRGIVCRSDSFSPDYLTVSQAERERFRRMTHADTGEVAMIENASISQPWSQKSFDDSLDNESAFFIVCEGAGKIKGYAGMWISGEEADITNVAVDEKFRRIGIGKGLIEYLVEQGKNKGVTTFFLEVRTSNDKALALYKKSGFKEIGERADFYCNPKEDAILMQLKL